MRSLKPVHPGDILLRDFMEPLQISSYRLARLIGVATPTVNEIVRRRKSVTAEMALRLARYFGTSPQLWLNLQTQYDLEAASRRLGRERLRKILPRSAGRPGLARTD